MERKYCDWNEFEEGCQILAEQIKPSLSLYKSIYGEPRGGLCVAVRLSHLLGLPLVMEPEEDSLVVDDIADTGHTMSSYDDKDVAVLYKKFSCDKEPKYYAWETCRWVIFAWEFGINYEKDREKYLRRIGNENGEG